MNPTPDALFGDIPILKSEHVPECPTCGKKATVVVMQGHTGVALAMCMDCGNRWWTPRILGEEEQA